MRDYLFPTQKEALDTIVRVVAIAHDVTPEDILGPSKRAPIVRIRHMAFTYARRITKASYPRLGQYFNRTHDVILRGIRRHEERMGENANV